MSTMTMASDEDVEDLCELESLLPSGPRPASMDGVIGESRELVELYEVVDRVGRKGLLVASLVVYAVVGTAPLYLPTLPLVVASRVLVGLTEAAIMTCCTTLLADYFHGRRREKMLGLQVVFTSVSATVFFGVGGALGAAGWRTPLSAKALIVTFTSPVSALV